MLRRPTHFSGTCTTAARRSSGSTSVRWSVCSAPAARGRVILLEGHSDPHWHVAHREAGSFL